VVVIFEDVRHVDVQQQDARIGSDDRSRDGLRRLWLWLWLWLGLWLGLWLWLWLGL
jgi:hypothetical protein